MASFNLAALNLIMLRSRSCECLPDVEVEAGKECKESWEEKDDRTLTEREATQNISDGEDGGTEKMDHDDT